MGWPDAYDISTAADRLGLRELRCDPPAPDLRARQLDLQVNDHTERWTLLWNEGEVEIETTLALPSAGRFVRIDPVSTQVEAVTESREMALRLPAGRMCVLRALDE